MLPVDSGEWNFGDWRALGKRLKTFCPKNELTGRPITQEVWGDQVGIAQTTWGQVLSGRNVRMETVQKIVFWMIQSGYTAEDVVWWETGYRQPPRQRLPGQ